MFFESFKITGIAMAQIFLLGSLGFLLMKKGILGGGGLTTLSRMVVEVTLPALIFCQLVRDFRFDAYSHWWVFPVLSLAVTLAGFLLGLPFIGLISGRQKKWQFLSLVSFQNSGYLPLALIAAMLPKDKATPLFIYLFLFLLGFNLLVWSLGVYMLSANLSRRFELGSLFSPPVISCIFSLIIVGLGFNRLVPEALLKPLGMIGDCTLPLAMLVVGASLAELRLRNIDLRAMFLVVLVKLILLPALGFWLVLKLKLPELAGLLIIMELAVPSATSLSVITRHYQKEDLLISQGVFFTHIISLASVPLFLSLYYSQVML